MPKLVWFNQPTNHSGSVNFLFLNADGEVDKFSLYAADGGGPYILGGPALTDYRDDFTEAGLTLISLLPAAVAFYPKSIAKHVKSVVREKQHELKDTSDWIDSYEIRVLSKDYSTTQCCDLLLSKSPPQSAIVFVSRDGELALAMDLARIYYTLPKERRKALNLRADWTHHWDT